MRLAPLTLGAYCITFVFLAIPARAGFFEVSASGSYKKVNVTDTVATESRSVTGSLSYLLDEMSAVEFSYTEGSTKQNATVGGVSQTTTVDYSMLGLDFILTLGDREATLRPYFKLGAAYILEKQLQVTYAGFPPGPPEKTDPVLVPSLGAGFRLALTKTLSLKTGVDAWTSKSITESNVKWDYAGKVGLSWLF